jgi:AraC-like DNA-binding protein
MNSLRHLIMQEFKLHPGDEWRSDTPCWCFLQLSSGAAYWLGPHESRSLVVGEMLVIAPDVCGDIRASQLTEVVLQGFSFALDNLLGFFTLNERHIFDTELATHWKPVRFLPSTHPASQRLAALAPTKPGGTGLGQRAEVLGVVATVFDPGTPMHRQPEPLGPSPMQRFQRLISEMPDVEVVNYSPGELAQLCGCCLRHFNHLFRKHFGTSVRGWQAELRLLKACQCLRNTDSSVAAVAEGCGFQSVEKFNLLFETRFRLTPDQWRRGQEAGCEIGINSPVEPAGMTTAENWASGVARRH